jgi:uncharacterized membrane protein YidH (DUF202 family)
MAARRVIGFVLIALGLIALIWGGISWTRNETVVDAGPLEIQSEQRETIPMPPILGAVALVAGVLLVAMPSRTRG